MTDEPNTVRGDIKCDIGDVSVILRPTFRRISKLESALGRSLVKIVQDLSTGGGISITDVVTMIDVLAIPPKPERDAIGEAVVSCGLQAALPAVQAVLERVILGPSQGNSEEGGPSAE